MQVDEAVDQAQLHVQARVGHQEVGNRRRQVAAAECGGGIDADQALGRIAQRHRFGAGQAQFFDDAPGPFGNAWPAGVARTAWVLRVNRRLPTAFSRLSMRRATADGVSG